MAAMFKCFHVAFNALRIINSKKVYGQMATTVCDPPW